MSRGGVLSTVFVAACLWLGTSAVAEARSSTTPDGPDGSNSPAVASPVVVLSRYEVDADDEIDVTVAGFSARTVTVSVCGNRALRGSADCNMAASESTRINPDGVPNVVRLPIDPPPMPCPCLVRVSSSNNDEVATAEFTLVGHPVAEPVSTGLASQPVVASVRAVRAGDGATAWLKSSLGGTTAYDVTYTIGNTATVAAQNLTLVATVGRTPDDVATSVELAGPDRLEPGDTWEHTSRVELGAPVWGSAYWEFAVSSNAPTVTASDTTSHRPALLILLIGVLVVDVVVLLVRFVIRRVREARDRPPDSGPPNSGTPDGGAFDDLAADELVLIG